MKDNGVIEVNYLKFILPNVVFNCRVLGTGKNIIVAFHGFGQDGEVFLPFATQHPGYTIYSFDLPFHGATKVADSEQCLEPKVIVNLISLLMASEHISRFSLLSFSIGSKLVFPIIKRFADSIHQVWLMAPDGIVVNFWYRLATATYPGRALFTRLMQHPATYGHLLRVVGNLGLIHKNKIEYALNAIKNPAMGKQLSDTWIYLRQLNLESLEIADQINAHGIVCYFVLASRDLVIDNSAIKPWSRKLKNTRIIKLPSSHAALLRNFVTWSAKIFQANDPPDPSV
ncbi:MAG: hypothetical protein HC819_11640 [Cyclobacteriaceae bacterium]|nr:hypothetical protein [Cyclobacteriaceae bacterium]